jgi:hypothetical protein
VKTMTLGRDRAWSTISPPGSRSVLSRLVRFV